MSNWIFFTLLAELMWAFTALIDKIMLSKGYVKSSRVFAIFSGLNNVFLIFLIPFFDFGHLSRPDFIAAMLGGLFLSIGVIFYFKAVQYEEISRVLILWQSMPIFVLVMSFLFLKELLTRNHFIGFMFLFAAGIIISYRKINGSFRLSRAFYYMLASALFISIYYILSKHIYKAVSFWSAFMWLRLFALAPIFLLLLPSIRRQFVFTFRGMNVNVKSLMLLKMAVDFSAFIVLGLAILSGPISLVSALGGASAPIFIFVITLFTTIYFPHIVREDIDKRSLLAKMLAIMLAIVGIILVNS